MATGPLGAFVVAVDMDLTTPGIQESAEAAPGSTLTVGVILIDDGASVLSGFGLSLNANDAGPVVDFVSPTVAASLAAGHVDLVTGASVGPGVPLAPAALPLPLGFGETTGGSGHFDPSGAGIPGVGVFGAAGVEHLLLSVEVEVLVAASAGSTTVLFPEGILFEVGGFATGADPKTGGPLVPEGAMFWDADFFSGIGDYEPTETRSGNLTVTPEPGAVLLLLGAACTAGFRRRR